MATDWNCLFHRSLRAYIFCNCFSQLLKTKHSNLAICFAIGNVMTPIISINSFVIFSRCWLSHHSRFVTELVCFKRKDKLKILRQFYTIDCPVKGQYSKFSIISGILANGFAGILVERLTNKVAGPLVYTRANMSNNLPVESQLNLTTEQSHDQKVSLYI